MADTPQLDVTLGGLSAALRTLDKAAERSDVVIQRALKRIGFQVQATAMEYAPRSATDTDSRKAKKQAGSSKPRKKRKPIPGGQGGTEPGGLERSIEFEVRGSDVEIFVADNSDAGPYAWIIHEEKGNLWKNRGLGTVSKGQKADEKFITRAIEDEENAALLIIQSEIDAILT